MNVNSGMQSGEIPSGTLKKAISCLAEYHGKDISHQYLLESLGEGEGVSDFSLVEEVLFKSGLSVSLAQTVDLNQITGSCCVLLKNGRVATILQSNDENFVVAILETKDGVMQVAKNTLAEQYAGTVLFAGRSLDETQTYLIAPPQKGHWFWREVRQQKSLFRDAVIGSLCANLLAACIALFSLQIYDRVIPHQSTATLWVLVSGVVIAILLEASLRISRAHLLDASGRQLEIRLSKYLFEKFIGGRLTQQSLSPGAKVHAVKEFGSVREFFTAASIGSAADIPFAVIFLGLIFVIAGNVAFVVMFAMGLIVLPSLLAQKKIAKLSEEMQGGSSAAGKLLIESAYAQDSVKMHQAEGFVQKKWEDIVALNAVKTTEQRVLSAGLMHSAQAIQQAAYVVAIIAGVFLVFAGDFTVGSIIAISILSTRTLAPITQLSSIVMRWQQVKTSMTALEAIVNDTQDRPSDREFLRHPNLAGEISLENVQFQYGEKNPVLNITQFAVKPGENVAILGMNGSGKTTLLKVISGLFDFSQGEFSIDGLDARLIDPYDLRRNIGYLPQEVKLFAGTLRENLTFGSLRSSDEKILSALNFAGLSDLIRKDPKGLDLLIEDGGAGLSLGQRQCVGLARLFLQDPQIVLLDEPTASLDQNLERKVIERLQLWLKGRTCVMSTHRVQPLELVDRIIVLQDGKIVLDDIRERALRKLKLNGDAQPAKSKTIGAHHEAA